MQGAKLSIYIWNLFPIYGTDIIRLFETKGREFPLPILFALESTPKLVVLECQTALTSV